MNHSFIKDETNLDQISICQYNSSKLRKFGVDLEKYRRDKI